MNSKFRSLAAMKASRKQWFTRFDPGMRSRDLNWLRGMKYLVRRPRKWEDGEPTLFEYTLTEKGRTA